jgi:hypothetical protein
MASASWLIREWGPLWKSGLSLKNTENGTFDFLPWNLEIWPSLKNTESGTFDFLPWNQVNGPLGPKKMKKRGCNLLQKKKSQWQATSQNCRSCRGPSSQRCWENPLNKIKSDASNARSIRNKLVSQSPRGLYSQSPCYQIALECGMAVLSLHINN